MAETIKGINVQIGADVTGLSAALSDVNQKSRDISSELKGVERLLKFNPKDTQLLAQKQKLLGDQVATTREKLDRLKSAQAQVNEQFKAGKISEGQYRAFQREVIETESKLKHFETQLKNTGSSVEELGKKMQAASEKLDKTGKTLTKTVTAPIAIAGAAAFKMAADIEDAFGATDQVFNSASGAVKDWARNLESYYGIAETEALEYSNMMGSMLKNIGGLTEDQAAKQSQTLIELAGDLTAMFGGTTADAVRALTGALKGNNTMLDNYGMAVNDAMIKTKAYELGLFSGTGQMDLATKQAATLALIMEQSGAAQGQAAREAEGASGSMRALMTELKNLATTFGQILLPIITPFIAKLGEMVKWIKDLSPSIKQTIVLIAGIVTALGPALLILAQITMAVKTLTPVFAALTSSTGLWIAAIGALVTAGILLYKNWDVVKGTMLKIWDSIVYGVQQAISYLKTLLFGYIKMWIDAINVIGKYIPGLNKALDSAKTAVEGWIEAEKNAIQYRREERGEIKAQQEALKQEEADIRANQAAVDALAQSENNLATAQRDQILATEEQSEAVKEMVGTQQLALESAGQAWLGFVQTAFDSSRGLKDAVKEMVVSILSALQRQIVASAAAAEALAFSMSLGTFGASLGHLAVIAAKVLPKIAVLEALKAGIMGLAEGAMITGPTLAVVGERRDRKPEAVLPLTEKVLSGIGAGIAANMPQLAGAGGGNVDYHFHIGVMIGDERGYKQLARKVFSYEHSEKRRLGE